MEHILPGIKYKIVLMTADFKRKPARLTVKKITTITSTIMFKKQWKINFFVASSRQMWHSNYPKQVLNLPSGTPIKSSETLLHDKMLENFTIGPFLFLYQMLSGRQMCWSLLTKAFRWYLYFLQFYFISSWFAAINQRVNLSTFLSVN